MINGQADAANIRTRGVIPSWILHSIDHPRLSWPHTFTSYKAGQSDRPIRIKPARLASAAGQQLSKVLLRVRGPHAIQSLWRELSRTGQLLSCSVADPRGRSPSPVLRSPGSTEAARFSSLAPAQTDGKLFSPLVSGLFRSLLCGLRVL